MPLRSWIVALHAFRWARSALCYQGRKAAKNAAVVERMEELSAQYPRYGYRRIRIFRRARAAFAGRSRKRPPIVRSFDTG